MDHTFGYTSNTFLFFLPSKLSQENTLEKNKFIFYREVKISWAHIWVHFRRNLPWVSLGGSNEQLSNFFLDEDAWESVLG